MQDTISCRPHQVSLAKEVKRLHFSPNVYVHKIFIPCVYFLPAVQFIHTWMYICTCIYVYIYNEDKGTKVLNLGGMYIHSHVLSQSTYTLHM